MNWTTTSLLMVTLTVWEVLATIAFAYLVRQVTSVPRHDLRLQLALKPPGEL